MHALLPPRRLMTLTGTPAETAAAAARCVARLEAARVLWLGESASAAEAVGAADAVTPAASRRLLGQSRDAVILDCHDHLDPDLLGRAHGFVRGGGALILRLPPAGALPAGGRRLLAVPPFGAEAVTDHFLERFMGVLAHSHPVRPGPLDPPPAPRGGTTEQARAVAALLEGFCAPAPGRTTLIADRGRGKSSALGLALAALRAALPDRTVVLCGPQPEAVGEVLRFAGPLAFATPDDLILGPARPEVIVIDEAAQIPVPALQRLVHRHPQARLAFATTTHGYEGTGRGFVLRFLRWLEAQGPVRALTLREPIRWAADDPLEAFVFDALLLDAQPAAVPEAVDPAACEAIVLDRGALARDGGALRELFGILVHAHYRTTPSDLQRMLDAPNLRLHALRHQGRIVAACWVALEGGLSPEWIDDLYWGRRGIRGHALAETLICHGGRRDGGALRLVRSVRIAAHPGLHRLGLGRRLVDHVHATYQPDLFGTLFGATPELLAFRRGCGYHLVRLGVSAGSRTGEPAAVMLRPASPAGRALVDTLRGVLARDLPLQLELMAAGDRIFLEPALVAACLQELPPPVALSDAERDAAVRMVVFGARPFEAAAVAVRAFCEAHPAARARLGAQAQILIEARVLGGAGWPTVQAAAGLSSVRATMRALRRALQALALAVGLEPAPARQVDSKLSAG